ncbi:MULTISPECIES: hypothetical protein [unclassified Streptomyces]|uniref:hypothetical protein n=1 Tax=unclassified Streptomyces TaxID=2593676 RepID=UPI002F914AD8
MRLLGRSGPTTKADPNRVSGFLAVAGDFFDAPPHELRYILVRRPARPQPVLQRIGKAVPEAPDLKLLRSRAADAYDAFLDTATADLGESGLLA